MPTRNPEHPRRTPRTGKGAPATSPRPGAAPDELVERVFRALLDGELERGDLGARRLSEWLGASTMVLYHHFGSLEGLLIRVEGRGWKRLLGELVARDARGASLSELVLAYFDFALAHPDLYWLMAERRFDRPELLRQNRLSLGPLLWGSFVALVERHGGSAVDAQLLFATLHGLVSLHASGRGNLGESPVEARALARAAVEHQVSRLIPASAPGVGRTSATRKRRST